MTSHHEHDHDGHNEGGASYDDHHHEGEDDGPEFLLYSRPVQRQRWGDEQPHPHTNWGDTFFDLFYVSAAYNLGTLIRSEINGRGVLYFMGCFWPILLIWQYKMYYDSRYYTSDDSFHRGYELGILIALATAVLHIRPVTILSNSNDNIDMFTFSLAIVIAHLLSIGRIIEVYFNVNGEPAAKLASRRDIIWTIIPLLFYIPAIIVAGTKYYGTSTTTTGSDPYDSGYGYTTEEEEDYSKNVTHEEDGHYDDEHHFRFLAGGEVSASSSSYGDEEYDVPIYLLVVGSFTTVITMIAMVLSLPKDGRHKEVSVPMNINFVIHRFGEWTMLMLGESVLSLLIVDVVETAEYYSALFSGIISITLLEYLHFRSQPHDPDDHAMRRKKEAGIVFNYLMVLYSMALVALGTSYKMLLYELYNEDKYNNNSSKKRSLFPAGLSRLLAGTADDGSASGYDPERRQNIAHWFCISLALVWFCSDAMIIVHRGISDHLGRCRMNATRKDKRLIAFVLVFIRFGLIVWMATLSQYVTQPETLAGLGLLGIGSQVALRFAGSIAFDEDDEDLLQGFVEEASEGFKTWPNTTQPQATTTAHHNTAVAKSSEFLEKIEE